MKKIVLPEIDIKPVLKVGVLSSLYHYHYTPSFTFAGEFHSAWELVYVSLGEVVVVADNTEFIVSAQQFFLHKPDEFHKIRANNQDCAVVICSFSLTLGHDALLTLCSKVNSTNEHQRRLLKDMINELQSLFAYIGFNVEDFCKITQHDSMQIIANCLENFFILSLRLSNHRDEHNMNGSNIIMNNAIQYLNQHLSEHITVGAMAKSLGYSASYLSKLFVRSTKKSIITFLNEMRINRAKEMFAADTQTLSEISELLGFSSLQYFSIMFKKYTGFSPTEYKKSLAFYKRYDFDWL